MRKRTRIVIDLSSWDPVDICHFNTLCSLHECSPNMMADIALRNYIAHHVYCGNDLKLTEVFHNEIRN